MFLPGSAAVDAAARIQNLGYAGGAISGPVGTLDYFFNLSAGNTNYCNAQDVAVARRSYTRVRVIGGTATTVKAANFTVKKYPFVDDQTGQAGKEMTIEDPATGDKWVVRRRGSMQDLVAAICGGSLVPGRAFYLRSQRGRTYGPFLPPSAVVTP